MSLRRGTTVSNVAVMGGEVAPPAFAVTWRGHYDDETDLSTYTVSAAAFGIADASRKIVIGVYVSSTLSTGITSVTAGGITGTAAVGGVSGTRTMQMWVVDVPTGESGDITITHSGGGNSRVSCDWWSVSSTSQSTYASRSGSVPDVIASDVSLNLGSVTNPTGGAIMAIAASNGSASMTWTQTSGTGTRRSDEAVGGSGWSSAYDTQEVGAQVLTITVGVAANLRGCAIAWGP